MLILLATLAFAADGGLVLEDALRRAVQTSEDVAVAEAGLDSARSDQAAALAGWLPSVGASGAYQRTFASEYDGLFGGASTGPFGAPNSWRVGLEAYQGIYQGGAVLAQRRLAAAGRSLASEALVSARANTVLATAQAFYNAQLANRLLEIATGTLEQANRTLQEVTLAHEVGRVPEFEVLRAKVQAENQRVAVLQQKRQQQLAHASLRQLLHMEPNESLDLATGIDFGVPEDAPVIAAEVAGIHGQERLPVTQARDGLAAAQATLNLSRAQGLPSLAASASYGWVNYPDSLFPEGDWAKNASAGLSLSVPLFGGGGVRAGIAGAQADVRAAEQRLAQASAVASLDSADSALAVEVATAQYEAASGTIEQAGRAYEIAEIRYQEGVSTQTELADARLLLFVALANRATAARDLQLARIRLALLPALPVQVGVSY